MSREEISNRGLYYSIIKGTFRQKVDQDHPDAVRRDYETSDGKKGIKYERVIDALYGYITDIAFYDSEYGMKINIILDENQDGIRPNISLPTQSREAEDFMKKLPNIDLTKEVKLRPFNFTGDNDDEIRGMEILQPNDNDEYMIKITNFFRDAEKKENINGYPNPPKESDEMDKEDWKIYFIQARKFLVAYTGDKIVPTIPTPERPKSPKSHEEEKRNTYPEEDINPADIPF